MKKRIIQVRQGGHLKETKKKSIRNEISKDYYDFQDYPMT